MIEKIETCSVQDCNNELRKRPLSPITNIEKEHGLMCIDCLQEYYESETSNVIVCSVCEKVTEIIHLRNPKFNKKELFCEKCLHCGGDELQQQTLYLLSLFQNIKRKLHKWQTKHQKKRNNKPLKNSK